MGLDLEKYRKQQAEVSKKGGAYGWRPESGKENTIRVFLFEHKITKQDAEVKIYPKEKIGKIEVELSRVLTRHFGLTEKNNPVFSTPQIMAYYDKIKKSKDPDDIAKAKAIRPDRKYYMNVVDINDQGKGILVYAAPKTVYKEILKYLIDPEYGEEIFGCKGRDFKITYDKDAEAADMYSVLLRDAKKCEKLPSDLEDDVKDLFDPAVSSSFAGEYSGEVLGDEEAETKEEDDGEEDLEDDAETEEEEEAPKKKGR